MVTKDKSGKFAKRLSVWDGTSWDDGWYDNRGRFRVYRPDYPRAFAGGYALRAWVVWWLHCGMAHPVGTNLHHKNHIKDDDRLENLEVIEHGEHSKLHNFKPSSHIELICQNCGRPFKVTTYKIESRKRDGQDGIKFCSQKCYHTFPKSEQSKQKQSESLKIAYQEGRKATPQGRKHTEETKLKMSKSQKGKKRPRLSR